MTKPTNSYWMLKTGHTDYTKRKNIYDLAGNQWEYTSERFINSDGVICVVVRGAQIAHVGNHGVASMRGKDPITTIAEYVSPRIVLYVL